MDKNKIIQIIMSNPNMAMGELKKNALASGINENDFMDAWNEAKNTKQTQSNNVFSNIVKADDNSKFEEEVEVLTVPKKNKKKALLITLIATPIILFLGKILGVIFLILGFNLLSENIIKFSQVINIIFIVIYVVLEIYSIYLFLKKEKVKGVFDKRSGLGANSIIPEEIKKENSAAGLTYYVWSLYHGIWIYALIPFLFNIVLYGLNKFNILNDDSLGIASVVLFLIMFIFIRQKGNELAWKAIKWESVSSFLALQEKWYKITINIIIGIIIMFFLMMFIASMSFKPL